MGRKGGSADEFGQAAHADVVGSASGGIFGVLVVVSLLSDAGVPVEEISRLVGHSGTSVTALVYRHQIRPVIQTGATAMDRRGPELTACFHIFLTR